MTLVRFVAGLAVLWLGLSLSACDLGRPGAMAARIAKAQAQRDPPQLWRVEQVRWDGAIEGTVEVCVDPLQLAAFRRPAAEVNGQTCVTYGPAKLAPDNYETRCAAMGATYTLRVRTRGDPAQSFETWFSLTPVGGGARVAQDRRYRRLGTCPPGWSAGRQALRSHRRVSQM